MDKHVDTLRALLSDFAARVGNGAIVAALAAAIGALEGRDAEPTRMSVEEGAVMLWIALGYVATVANIAGNLMLVKKRTLGWMVRLATNMLYAAYALGIEDSGPVLLNHVVFAAINIRGWIVWRRDGRVR